MSKALKLWNGRLSPYEHGYVAAYSRADAVRVLEQHAGGSGYANELRVYWHAGAWGNSMLGVTPERGLWAERKGYYPRQIIRLIDRQEILIGLTPERQEYIAQQKADVTQEDAKRAKAHADKVARVKKLASVLVVAGFRVGVKDGAALVEWEGYEYKVTEAGPVPERDAETSTLP